MIVGFDVLEVKRDGRAEPYALEALNNGTRIRIGDKDVFLDDGLHRYEITYRTTRQIGFFTAYDELYWNVTGNGWTFAIDKARVVIRLPAGANIIQHAEYTGYQGNAGKDVRVTEASGQTFAAETTRRLGAQEGFTVAVGWQKGIVAPPTSSQSGAGGYPTMPAYFALALGLLLSGGYFLLAWNKVGRDPQKGTIIPLFAPPNGVGPAAARYVTRYGFDDKGFAAALVGLAVKGRLKIADDDKTFTITKLAEPPRAVELTSSERLLYGALPSGSTELKQANHRQVGGARAALGRALKQEYDGSVFLRNLGWFAVGTCDLGRLPHAGRLLLPGAKALPGSLPLAGRACGGA